jgi:deoxyribonuclease IV
VGLKNVRAIHFNDSRAVYNSRVDRHWHIGEGHIGMEALRRVAQHPKLRHCAFILETPYDDPRADLQNLQTLRSFVRFEGSNQTKLSGQEGDPVPAKLQLHLPRIKA